MHRQHIRERGRSLWPIVAYLSFFVILILAVWNWYLVPMIKANAAADAAERPWLGVHALLVMCLLLLVFGYLLLVVMRVQNWSSRRAKHPPSTTVYTDAWAESGRRMREKKLDE